jgi:hypothetical protein
MGRLAAGQNWTQANHAPTQGQDPMTWYAGMLPGPVQRTAALDQLVFADGPRAFALVVVGLRDANADAAHRQRGARASYDFEVVRLVVPASESVLRAMRAMHGEMVSPQSMTSPKPPQDADETPQPDQTDPPSPDSPESPDSPQSLGAPR